MPRLVEYTKNAEAAEEMAKNVTDASIREHFEEIARQWRAMAKQAAKLRAEKASKADRKG